MREIIHGKHEKCEEHQSQTKLHLVLPTTLFKNRKAAAENLEWWDRLRLWWDQGRKPTVAFK